MRLIKSHASGHKLIACRGQKEVSFSPHAALHNWLSALSGGAPAHWLCLEWVTKPHHGSVLIHTLLPSLLHPHAHAVLVLTTSPGVPLLLISWASSAFSLCAPGSSHCLQLPLSMLSALPHLLHHPHLASAPCHKLQHAGWEPRLISLAQFVWPCPKLTLCGTRKCVCVGSGVHGTGYEPVIFPAVSLQIYFNDLLHSLVTLNILCWKVCCKQPDKSTRFLNVQGKKKKRKKPHTYTQKENHHTSLS